MTDADEVLAGLDPDQRLAALALDGPVVVLAGAGSGKTRAITHRIAYGVLSGQHDPRRSVAVTFTTKAAGEMSRRLRALGVPEVRVRTFHAAALRQLRYYWPTYIGGDFPELTASKLALVGGAASRRGFPTDPTAVRDLAAEIEWAKVSQLHPSDYAVAAMKVGRDMPSGLAPAQVAEVFAGYEQAKDAAGRLDFEDVLLFMVALLEREPGVGAHLRPGLRHLTVDEYQDVSPLQQRLLELWLGDNRNLCVVGDAAQTIYTFAGADPGFLTGFAARYPDACVVRLERTYRCSPEISATANKVLALTGGAGVRLVSQREPGPAVRIVGYADEEAEALGVVRRISALIADGVPPAEIAVLVRMNAMTERVEAALAEAGIGYQVAGGTRYFSRKEVRDAMTLFRGAAKATDSGGDLVTAVSGIVGGMGWAQAPPAGTGAQRERWEALSAMVEAAREFQRIHPGAGLADFVAELMDRAAQQDVPVAAGVTLASLHAAKGMEWQAVFLVGLNEGVLPHGAANSDAEIAEEKRLLYVGVTRAARQLELSYAEARASSGRRRKRSRFLDAIEAATPGSRAKPKVPSKGQSRTRTAKLAACRVCGVGLSTGAERTLGRCRTCPGDADVELLDNLRAWRTTTAEALSAERGTRMPAYVVATDATLQAIAEQHPKTLAELAEIPGIGPRKIADYGPSLLELLVAE